MLGFGWVIGLLFPFVMVVLGVPRETALRPVVFAATLVAGLVVAQVNFVLAQGVVGVRLKALASGMQRVEGSLVDAAFTGDWTASTRPPARSRWTRMTSWARSPRPSAVRRRAGHQPSRVDSVTALSEALPLTWTCGPCSRRPSRAQPAPAATQRPS